MLLLVAVLQAAACAAQKLSAAPEQRLLADTALRHAFTGIAVYDVTGNRWLHRHNSEKYFVPASNTKIATLYAGTVSYTHLTLPTIYSV